MAGWQDEEDALREECVALRARVKELEDELLGWEECAQYDAMMDGPRFKGWDRSALDRMRRQAEARALLASAKA